MLAVFVIIELYYYFTLFLSDLIINTKMSVLKLLRPESKYLLDGLKCLTINGANKSSVNNHFPGRTLDIGSTWIY